MVVKARTVRVEPPRLVVVPEPEPEVIRLAPPITIDGCLSGEDLLYLLDQTGVEIGHPGIRGIAKFEWLDGFRATIIPVLHGLKSGIAAGDVEAELTRRDIGMQKISGWHSAVNMVAHPKVKLPELRTLIAPKARIGYEGKIWVATIREHDCKRVISLTPEFMSFNGSYGMAYECLQLR